MLSGIDLTRHHGAQTVLERVSVQVDDRTRLGVVGPNGVGKSTLVRILAGLEAPDAGRVERAPATLTVGALPQEIDTRPGETLHGYLARRTGVAAASAALDAATHGLEEGSVSVEAYTEALDHFVAIGGGDFDARTGGVLAAVELPTDRLEVPLQSLSGGQAARAALAAILLSQFDVLLLDEPTNNLDFAGLDLLEGFLVERAGGLVVVSHDRAFLDRVVNRILEIDEHDHTGVEYAGGWSDYVAARGLRRSQQAQAHEEYVVQRGELQDRIREQRQWAVQGVARQKRKPRDHDKAQQGFFKNRTEKQAGKLKASERALARLDANAVDKPWESWELRLSLASTNRSGDVVARLDGAVVERGAFRLGPVDLEVGWRERLALVGPNGTGKSTLLDAVLGRVPLVAGTRWLGPGVVVGELDQARRRVADDQPVLAGFLAASGLAIPEARALLAKFGIGADHVERRAGQLSPGERTRLLLALLMATGTNCLVLDEPTNHLDVPAIEQLEQALGTYDGTLLLVTHDRRFLESVAITRVVDVTAWSHPSPVSR
jgi:ATPase subunit of ABC transporter with duplicated ATPase domains